MEDKILRLKAELEGAFLERHDEISGALLAMLSGEHIVFLGPPGTAKSLLARKVCEAVDGGRFFYYLLTRFTTPDEIFGPLSIKALQEDRFHRQIENSLPTAHIAFLDEVFKANSSILNSLLTILNEKEFHNGPEVVPVPILSVFGASNELPEEEERESLRALYDRFLFRYYVSPVQEEANFTKLIAGRAEDYEPSVRISAQEILALQEDARRVRFGDDVRAIILELRRRFRSENLEVSDRRWKKIMRVLSVAARSLGLDAVDRTMALLLPHMLWDEWEQHDHIRGFVLDLVVSGGVNLDDLKREADGLRTLTEQAADYKFPHPVYCRSCEEKFATWKQVVEHNRQRPDHEFQAKTREPYQRGESDPKAFREVLQARHGWDVKMSIPDANRRIYRRELSELRARKNQARQSLENERDDLKRSLRTNIWISERDRTEVLFRHEAKTKLLHEIDKSLALTEKSLEEPEKEASEKAPDRGKAARVVSEEEATRDLGKRFG